MEKFKCFGIDLFVYPKNDGRKNINDENPKSWGAGFLEYKNVHFLLPSLQIFNDTDVVFVQFLEGYGFSIQEPYKNTNKQDYDYTLFRGNFMDIPEIYEYIKTQYVPKTIKNMKSE